MSDLNHFIKWLFGEPKKTSKDYQTIDQKSEPIINQNNETIQGESGMSPEIIEEVRSIRNEIESIMAEIQSIKNNH